MSRIGWLMLVIGVTAMGARPAIAQTMQEQELEQRELAAQPTSSDWNVTLGGGIAAAPRFPGANTDRARLVPLALIEYRDWIFLGPAGLGANLIDSGGWRVGPIMGLWPGRSEERDEHLNGLGDISGSVTAGVFARYRVGSFEVGGTVRQAVTPTDNGLLGLLHADYRVSLGDRLSASFGPEIEFANARYSRTWFGVTPTQSQDSGLPVFTPRAGVKDVGVHASLTYRASQHVLLRTFANFKELTGDISDSPIVQCRNQLLVGAGLAYHF